jgi:hypothetical protein
MLFVQLSYISFKLSEILSKISFGIYNEIVSSALNEIAFCVCEFASSFSGHGANARTTVKLSPDLQVIFTISRLITFQFSSKLSNVAICGKVVQNLDHCHDVN